MNWNFRIRFLVIPLLVLSLSGCLGVTHRKVENGKIIAGPVNYYDKSPDRTIIVEQDPDGVSPKVYLQFSARSDQGLFGIRYSIEKYNNEVGSYQRVGAGSKLGISNVGRQLVCVKSIVLSEYDGMPILLDLSGTGMSTPLKLTFEAIERDGNTKIIEAKYFEWPKILDIGGH